MEIFNALLQIDLENFVENILKKDLRLILKSDLFIALNSIKLAKKK